MSPSPTHAIKEKINILVSLLILSSQDRELHREAVLSQPTESRIFMLTDCSGHCCSFVNVVTGREESASCKMDS